MRKRKPTLKRLPPEAYPLPASLLLSRPIRGRSGSSVPTEELDRQFAQANEAWENARRIALLTAQMRELHAQLMPAQRGRRASPIREAVITEAERRRAAGEPASATALLKWAKKNGKNHDLNIRTVRLWISIKRQ